MGNASRCFTKRRPDAVGAAIDQAVQPSNSIRRSGAPLSPDHPSPDPLPESSDTIYASLAGNGGGYGGHSAYAYVAEEECEEGIDEDLALLLTAAAIAVGGFVVFREITLRIKRKKRSSGDDDVLGWIVGRSALAGRCAKNAINYTLRVNWCLVVLFRIFMKFFHIFTHFTILHFSKIWSLHCCCDISPIL